MRLLLTRLAARPFLIVCNTPALARDKTVWSYEGGLFVITNGAIANGPCFRLAGRVTSGDFFDHLKRFDKESGTIFRRGTGDGREFSRPAHADVSGARSLRPDLPSAVRKIPTRQVSDARDDEFAASLSVLETRRGAAAGGKRERTYFRVRELIPKAAAQAPACRKSWNGLTNTFVPSVAFRSR